MAAGPPPLARRILLFPPPPVDVAPLPFSLASDGSDELSSWSPAPHQEVHQHLSSTPAARRQGKRHRNYHCKL
ncbi:unnamed protein product [Urochloa humidicola]